MAEIAFLPTSTIAHNPVVSTDDCPVSTVPSSLRVGAPQLVKAYTRPYNHSGTYRRDITFEVGPFRLCQSGFFFFPLCFLDFLRPLAFCLFLYSSSLSFVLVLVFVLDTCMQTRRRLRGSMCGTTLPRRR